MQTLFWAACFAVLLLLACMDFVLLWKLRADGSPSRGWFSPFTLACQGCFAVFAALHIAPEFLEGFSSSQAITVAELAFLVLMAIGALRDRARGKAGSTR